MDSIVASASFGEASIGLASENRTTAAASSCCERAVAEALETAGAAGSTAIVAMVVVGVAMLAVGFSVGLTTGWIWFG